MGILDYFTKKKHKQTANTLILEEIAKSLSSPGSPATIDTITPRSGRILGEDGQVYNFVDLMKALTLAVAGSGIGSNDGGGISQILWKPSVDENGTITWALSASTIPPNAQNIMGADGTPGLQGERGEPGMQGLPGIPGAQGENGKPGVGVPIGGTLGQVLTKSSDVDFATVWETPSVGGGEGGVSDLVWRPNVAADGTITWTLSASTTQPPAQNIRGLPGVDGADGINGTDGTPGLQGEQGLPGIPGKDGAQGEPGADGLSAYEIAVKHGFIGTEAQWLESLRGERGEQGIDSNTGQFLSIMPDLANRRVIFTRAQWTANNQTHAWTADENGFVFCRLMIDSTGSHTASMRVNGAQVFSIGTGTNQWLGGDCWYPVAKGDVVSITLFGMSWSAVSQVLLFSPIKTAGVSVAASSDGISELEKRIAYLEECIAKLGNKPLE